MTLQKRVFPALALALALAHGQTRAEEVKPTLNFQEIFGLLSSNLAGFPRAEIEKAAAAGLISQLGGRVELVSEAAAPGAGAALLTRTNVFDGGYAYFRVGRVGEGLAAAFGEAFDSVRSTNKLKGIVLDLRFAGGQDYKAAADLADRFAPKQQPLLKLGETTLSSTGRTNAIRLPLAVLINQKTVGAPEALAGALRQTEAALLIGNASAGQAFVFQSFPLSTGQQLRIGKTAVQLGDGQAIPAKGLRPDILVAVNPLDEPAYFEDAYKVVGKGLAAGGSGGATNGTKGLASLPKTRRSVNEAQLVRQHKEGLEEDAAPGSSGPDEPVKVVADPALARALDFLKGLAVALRFRPQ